MQWLNVICIIFCHRRTSRISSKRHLKASNYFCSEACDTIYLSIYGIYIAPLQGNYSEAQQCCSVTASTNRRQQPERDPVIGKQSLHLSGQMERYCVIAKRCQLHRSAIKAPNDCHLKTQVTLSPCDNRPKWHCHCVTTDPSDTVVVSQPTQVMTLSSPIE